MPKIANLSLRRHKVGVGWMYRITIGPPEGVLGNSESIDLTPDQLRLTARNMIDQLYRYSKDDGTGLIDVTPNDPAQ